MRTPASAGTGDRRLLVNLARLAAGVGLGVLLGAGALFGGMTLYLLAADQEGPVNGTGLLAFRIVFYAILAVATILTVGGTIQVTRSRLQLPWLYVAVIVDLVVIVAALSALFPYLSLMNACTLGASFPLQGGGCD